MEKLDTPVILLNKTIAHLEEELSQARAEIEVLKQAQAQERTQREQVELDLRASRQLLQLVMDTLPEAIFWKDRNSVYLGCNQNFAEDAGVDSPSHIVGKTDYDLAWKTEEADFFRACDQRVMVANCAELGIVEPQLQGDGKQAWLETNKAPLHDTAGNVIGILGTYQDITARKQAEIALRELNQKLVLQTAELKAALELIQSEKMSALGKLVAGMAHEINNPITFIHGNLTHIQEYTQDLLRLLDAYQDEYPHPSQALQADLDTVNLSFLKKDLTKILLSMTVGSTRIRDIVLSLRNFSRLDEAECKLADLDEGIDNTLLILQHRLKETPDYPEIEVVKEYGQLPLVECYPRQLNQVFMNLIDNAIYVLRESAQKPTKDDRPAQPGRIWISTQVKAENQVQIMIADNGLGMTETVRSRTFDPFFTTKPIGKGTGLGLTISYQIVTEKHNGAMWCESTLGEGTKFIIEIPIYQPKQSTP